MPSETCAQMMALPEAFSVRTSGDALSALWVNLLVLMTAGSGEMYITWVTGNATFYKSNPQPPQPVLKSEVSDTLSSACEFPLSHCTH